MIRAIVAARAAPRPAVLVPLVRSYTTPSTPTPTTPRQTPSATPTNLPGSNLPGAGKYSATTVSLVTGLAKLFGYNSQTSTAIRTASDYYDRCAERGELEAPFFYEGKCQARLKGSHRSDVLLISSQNASFLLRSRQNVHFPHPSKPGSPSQLSTCGSSPFASVTSLHLSDELTFKKRSTTSSSISNFEFEVPMPSLNLA